MIAYVRQGNQRKAGRWQLISSISEGDSSRVALCDQRICDSSIEVFMYEIVPIGNIYDHSFTLRRL